MMDVGVDIQTVWGDVRGDEMGEEGEAVVKRELCDKPVGLESILGCADPPSPLIRSLLYRRFTQLTQAQHRLDILSRCYSRDTSVITHHVYTRDEISASGRLARLYYRTRNA